jgi:hypothetical protein
VNLAECERESDAKVAVPPADGAEDGNSGADYPQMGHAEDFPAVFAWLS